MKALPKPSDIQRQRPRQRPRRESETQTESENRQKPKERLSLRPLRAPIANDTEAAPAQGLLKMEHPSPAAPSPETDKPRDPKAAERKRAERKRKRQGLAIALITYDKAALEDAFINARRLRPEVADFPEAQTKAIEMLLHDFIAKHAGG